MKRNSFAAAASFSIAASIAFGSMGYSAAYAVDGSSGEAPETVSLQDSDQGWNKSGSCEWRLDNEGNFVVRPIDGAEYGELDYGFAPGSLDFSKSIESFRFEGRVKVGELSGFFSGCSNVKSISLDGIDSSNSKSAVSMFNGCSSLKSLDLSGFNTGNIESMSRMFYGCSSLGSVDLSSFNTSKVESMESMFYGCSLLDALDLSSFDTSSNGGYGMSDMFQGCSSLRSLDLSSFDTRRQWGYTMTGLLRDCSSLESVKIGPLVVMADPDGNEGLTLPSNSATGRWVSSSDGIAYEGAGVPSGVSATYSPQEPSEAEGVWNQCGSCLWLLDSAGLLTVKPQLGAVGTLGSSFRDDDYAWKYCSDKIASVVFSPGVSSGWSMEGMFAGCSKLVSVDFSDFNTSGAGAMYDVFHGCSSLKSIDLSGFDTSGLSEQQAGGFFEGCESLSRISLGGSFKAQVFFPSSPTTGRWTSSINGISYEEWGIPVGAAAVYTPQDPEQIRGTWNQSGSCLWMVDADGALTIRPEDGNEGAIGYTYSWLDFRNLISSVDIEKGTCLGAYSGSGGLLNGCTALKVADLTNLDVANASNLNNFFEGCSSLESVDVSSFSTGNITSLYGMFSGCSSLRNINLASFDTSQVESMGQMFKDCSSLEAIDVSNFKTGKVSDMFGMFSGCSSLRELDLSSFATPHVEYANFMFENCSSLKRLDLSRFDTSAISHMTDIFWGCGSLQEVKLGKDFAFIGDESKLPAVNADQFPILWKNESGDVFSANDVPSYKADTYRAVAGGISRLSGETRYETAGLLADMGKWQHGGSVVLASGENYPDALAASSLAGSLDAPILLTEPSWLPEETESVIKTLKPANVYVVGGESAVSPGVFDQVSSICGSKMVRISGDTRYDTCVEVGKYLAGMSDTVIISTGLNYADALSMSPYAFATKSPIVLSSPSEGLSVSALEMIEQSDFSRAIVVGGTAAVPSAVERQLQQKGINEITRISGPTRYETSQRIFDFELSSGAGFTPDGMMFATGSNFPDALSAGPIAGKNAAPLLLVDRGAESICSYADQYRGAVSRAFVVGGQNAISHDDERAIAESLGI